MDEIQFHIEIDEQGQRHVFVAHWPAQTTLTREALDQADPAIVHRYPEDGDTPGGRIGFTVANGRALYALGAIGDDGVYPLQLIQFALPGY